ncbi:MAG: hypothetical protein ACQEQO_01115 [Thermodesulfobacteriota bacterium]
MKDKAVRAECQGKKTKDENVSGLSSAYRVFLHEELHNTSSSTAVSGLLN